MPESLYRDCVTHEGEMTLVFSRSAAREFSGRRNMAQVRNLSHCNSPFTLLPEGH